MKLRIFESHAHYDDRQFENDRDALLCSLPETGIQHLINVGCDLNTSKQSIALAKQYDYIYAAVGIHPSSVCSLPTDYLAQLKALSLVQKVVAIGEIGLDYHYDTPKAPQKATFIAQMQLAKTQNLPVIIHSRDAAADTLDVLRAFPGQPGVVHCFSGSAQTATELLSMGYHIGFTGVVTFQNAKKVIEAAAAVPLDRLMVETDCPYLAPTPHRGKRCDSTMLPHTIATLAEIKGVTPEELADATNQNACRLFGV